MEPAGTAFITLFLLFTVNLCLLCAGQIQEPGIQALSLSLSLSLYRCKMESCGNGPTRPWKLEFRSSKRFVIWVVSVGVFTVYL